jgi:hypothetical protein
MQSGRSSSAWFPTRRLRVVLAVCTSDGLASFTRLLSLLIALLPQLPDQADVVADDIDTWVRVGHASVGMVDEVARASDS